MTTEEVDYIWVGYYDLINERWSKCVVNKDSDVWRALNGEAGEKADFMRKVYRILEEDNNEGTDSSSAS